MVEKFGDDDMRIATALAAQLRKCGRNYDVITPPSSLRAVSKRHRQELLRADKSTGKEVVKDEPTDGELPQKPASSTRRSTRISAKGKEVDREGDASHAESSTPPPKRRRTTPRTVSPSPLTGTYRRIQGS